MQHDWVPSTLGHGNKMCRRCWATDLEAAALGQLNDCPAPSPAPKPANQNEREWTQDEIDADMFTDDDGPEPGEECGRWADGRLMHSCSKAGSEECDFECPHRSTLKF